MQSLSVLLRTKVSRGKLLGRIRRQVWCEKFLIEDVHSLLLLSAGSISITIHFHTQYNRFALWSVVHLFRKVWYVGLYEWQSFNFSGCADRSDVDNYYCRIYLKWRLFLHFGIVNSRKRYFICFCYVYVNSQFNTDSNDQVVVAVIFPNYSHQFRLWSA